MTRPANLRLTAAAFSLLTQPTIVAGYPTTDTARPPETIPVLRYDPPPNFYRSAIAPPDDYSSTEFNASLQIYPFRPAGGNVEEMFRNTMLREWIDPRYQEAIVASQPDFRIVSVAGAQVVHTARFVENVAGIARQRMRWVIIAGGAAAIIDASASDLMTWQRALPALNVFAGSLRVETAPERPAVTAGPGPAGRLIAGLYMARTLKDAVDLTRSVGYNMTRVPALHFYLFSEDGRVYRAYDELPVPGGDPRQFDFDAAERADPVNSGRYAVRGRQLVIEFQGQPPETIVAAVPRGGRLKIGTTGYQRQ